MSDTNEPRRSDAERSAGDRRAPAADRRGTDQLRIVGAEEAGALVARQRGDIVEPAATLDGDDDTDTDAMVRPVDRPLAGRPPVFASVPDAVPGRDDWAEPARRRVEAEPDPLDFDDLGPLDQSSDITVLGPAPSRPTERTGDADRLGRVPIVRPVDDAGRGRRAPDAESEDHLDDFDDLDEEPEPPRRRGPARARDLGRDAEPAARPAAVRRVDDDDERVELPHWTAPPTGQVPKVLIDDSRRDESWSTYASSPRWRDPTSDWDADDFSDVSDLAEDLPRVGALADRERPAIDEFFAFDDDAEAPAPVVPIGPPPRTRPPRTARRVVVDRDPTGDGRPGPPEPPFGPVGAARSGGRNVPVAAALGIGLGALAIVLFRLGPGPTMAMVAVLLGVGAVELFGALQRGGFHPATLLGLAASVGLPLAAYWRGMAAFPLVLALTVVFGLLWYLFGERERATDNLGVTLLGVCYVGGLGAFAPLILRSPGVDGTSILLAAIIPTVAHDVLGYVVGRNAGRSPLAPGVSPNKTVEGVLGGCIGAVIASVIFNDIILSTPFDGLVNSLLLGVVVAILAPLGDLAESMVKRDLGIKDMGSILPGHGGVLDRFDALLFVLPGVYYLALLLDIPLS